MLQLNPTIPIFVVSKNKKGYALGWIDYSSEHDLLWICGLDSGECWIVPNKDVRLQDNWSLGRVLNASTS